MLSDQDHHGLAPELDARPIWQSIRRGLRGRCPACGVGRLLSGYLTVNDVCPSCLEELHHHRADDFPQYVTIFIVAHVLAAAFPAVDDMWPYLPLSAHFGVWPILVVLLCLLLLPRIKGALITYQWALRMHGFETAHRLQPETAERVMPSVQRTAA